MKPEAVARAERLLGGEAGSWRRVESRGWTRNEHWTVILRDGSRAFLKEASIPPSPEWLRREADVLRLVRGPFAPELLAFEDAARPLLVLEDLSEGSHWPPPWRAGDVEAVLATLEEVAAMRVDSLLRFPGWHSWQAVVDDPAPFLSLGIASAAWLEPALPILLAAEESADVSGEALLHFDVRSDNLCLRDGRAVLVDWNFAARAGLPPPEGAPRVRAFQLAQLEIALPWACAVVGIEPPDLGR